VLYYAYGSNGRAVLEGRVIDHQVAHPPALLDTPRANLRRNLRLLFNKERPFFPVSAALRGHHWRTHTDVEGYFRIELHGLESLTPGWHEVKASAGAAVASIPMLLAPPQNVHGVISDFDDTLMVTEVVRFRRMLANTFLRNPLQRRVVPGMPALFDAFAARNPLPAAAPIFYVSASPRQLHMPLQAVLDHHGFPPGVLITKRITNDATREPLRDQLRYKMKRFEEILERAPHVTFTLIGDDGERDPEIFETLRERHPERVAEIWIRRVHPDPSRPRIARQGDLQELLSSVR
jgi:phosphatidate phosphatase APP1